MVRRCRLLAGEPVHTSARRNGCDRKRSILSGGGHPRSCPPSDSSSMREWRYVLRRLVALHTCWTSAPYCSAPRLRTAVIACARSVERVHRRIYVDFAESRGYRTGWRPDALTRSLAPGRSSRRLNVYRLPRLIDPLCRVVMRSCSRAHVGRKRRLIANRRRMRPKTPTFGARLG